MTNNSFTSACFPLQSFLLFDFHCTTFHYLVSIEVCSYAEILLICTSPVNEVYVAHSYQPPIGETINFPALYGD